MSSSRAGSLQGGESASFQWSQQIGRSRSPSFDWPLSVEEKKVRVMELFQKDVNLADDMLHSSQHSIKVLSDEIRRLRRHSWGGAWTKGVAASVCEHSSETDMEKDSESISMIADDSSCFPLNEDSDSLTSCTEVVVVVDSRLSCSPERTSKLQEQSKGGKTDAVTEVVLTCSPERVRPDTEQASAPKLHGEAERRSRKEFDSHATAIKAQADVLDVRQKMIETVDQLEIGQPAKGRSSGTRRCWRASRNSKSSGATSESHSHGDEQQGSLQGKDVPRGDKPSKSKHLSPRCADKKAIVVDTRPPRVENNEYVYFSGKTSPKVQPAALSRAKSEGKEAKSEKRHSEAETKVELRPAQNRGRGREVRCWKSQAKTQQESSLPLNDDQTSRKRRFSSG